MPPDKLHGRKTAFGNLKLKVAFNVTSNPPEASFLIVMVRIIDKIVDQRRIVFSNIDKWLSTKDGRYFCLAANHAEDIIADTKRILSFIKAHRSMKSLHVIVDKVIYKKIISRENEITQFRNALQHLDRDISHGRIIIDQDYGLVLTEIGYQINNCKISYEDLDELILDCDVYVKNVIAGLA
jgi:hypothetical protein